MSDAVQIDEKQRSATIKYGPATLLRHAVTLLAILGAPLLIAGAVAYSDGHNDARYVGKDTYEADKQLAALKERELDKKLGAIETLIREQSSDIKSLIRERK